MELIVLGVNVLLVMAVWKFILRKTILDHSRDRLFDLRSELRVAFIENKWDLNSPVYKRLRDLINGHLRYTEELAISKAIFFASAVKEDKSLQDFMHTRIQSIFTATDLKQNEFIKDFRKRALTVSLEYSIYSSGYLLLLTVVMTPFFACGMVVSLINRQVDITSNKCIQYVRHFGSYVAFVMSKSAALVARKVFLPDAVEAYSYRRGAAAV